MGSSRKLENAVGQYCFWLDSILHERDRIGESVLKLSQLQKQGLPTLPGFVIPARLCREFLEKLDGSWSLSCGFPHFTPHFAPDNPQALQAIARQTTQTILGEKLPADWLSCWLTTASVWQVPALILHPSLSLSRPSRGGLSGLLPPRICWCRPGALERGIKELWADLFSARSLFYWQRRGIDLDHLNCAVLVQPVQKAIASGRVEMTSNSLEIQATWGLGNSIQQGEVLPDWYQVDLASGSVKNYQLGHKICAYRLKQPVSASENAVDCLEAYWLSQEEQSSPALEALALDKLIQLVQRLKVPSFSQISLEWTLIQESGDREQQFYISQFLSCSPSSPLSLSPPAPSAILKGLPASPGRTIAPIEVIDDSMGFLPAVLEGSIWVTGQVNPAWLPWLKTAAGLLVENSGTTCHAAILARELGIPAIVGAKEATKKLAQGKRILLDGNSGEVFAVREGTVRQFALPTQVRESIGNAPLSTQLMLNLSQPALLPQAVSLPVAGVGLLRSELMLLDTFSGRSLDEWLQESGQKALVARIGDLISQFADVFAPRPVFYRSLDKTPTARKDQRGTASYLADPALFQLELQALAQVQAAGYKNINLILPLVRSVEEFRFCRLLVEAAGLMRSPAFQLWMMAEVPSALFLLPQYVAAGVQGIAIGSNDFAQFLLGVPREQLSLPDATHSYYEAVMAAIEQLTKLARKLGIPCSICGQLPVQHPEAIPSLIRWGMTAISVAPEAVEATYQAIALAEKSLLGDAV